MGLKVDSSFLKFLTMGALGTRRVYALMEQAGLQPIELERYSRSNKIWSTKVKRLRLPDLLCVKTGLRVEVRAKSKLAIKMSDAETNPDRRWNTGLAADDMIAFVLINEKADEGLVAADNAELFWVDDLVTTERLSKLGPAKSASEGAEKDREWPSTVANENGTVKKIENEEIKTTLQSGRSQSYKLKGKNVYFGPGDTFLAKSQFLAGVPAKKAALPNPADKPWNPRTLLKSASTVDRYVAVKALSIIGKETDMADILTIAKHDNEGRVALEAAVTLVRLGNEQGLEILHKVIENPSLEYLRMEALLALSELRDTPLVAQCVDTLVDCAQNNLFAENEVRQAAIWGLGKDGLRAYKQLLDFIDLDSKEELIHAVCAFGSDCPHDIAVSLVEVLTDPNSSDRRRAAASFILARTVRTETSAPVLIQAKDSPDKLSRNWILATLGQMNPTAIHPYVTDEAISTQLQLLHLTSPETNWTRSENFMEMITFVHKQTVDAPR